MSVAEELELNLREADVLVGRIMEAMADEDRAYERMLVEKQAAQDRRKLLEESLRGVTDNIARLRGIVRTGLSDYNTPKGV